MDDDEGHVARGEPTDDDAVWLDALAGRVSSADGPTGALNEGALLRRAITRWHPATDAVAAVDPERVSRLVARARAAGLLQVEEQASDAAAFRPLAGARGWARRLAGHGDANGRRRAIPTWALTALVVVVAGVVYIGLADRRTAKDEGTVRSVDGVVVRLEAAEPVVLQRRLVSALKAQGVEATPYVRFGRYGIDAELPSPPSNELRALLAREGVPLPADGVLRVEIEASRP